MQREEARRSFFLSPSVSFASIIILLLCTYLPFRHVFSHLYMMCVYVCVTPCGPLWPLNTGDKEKRPWMWHWSMLVRLCVFRCVLLHIPPTPHNFFHSASEWAPAFLPILTTVALETMSDTTMIISQQKGVGFNQDKNVWLGEFMVRGQHKGRWTNEEGWGAKRRTWTWAQVEMESSQGDTTSKWRVAYGHYFSTRLLLTSTLLLFVWLLMPPLTFFYPYMLCSFPFPHSPTWSLR